MARSRLGYRPFGLSASFGMAALAGLVLLSGCELEEVSIAIPEDVLVVEAYLMAGDETDELTAFLHWTLGTRPARDLLDASVTAYAEEGEDVPLFLTSVSDCVFQERREEVEGVCFAAGPDVEDVFQPGTRARLRVRLADGRELEGGTDVPFDIQLLQPQGRSLCALPPGLNIEFSWNPSPGTWAYSAEAEISGLVDALAATGVEVEADSVALLGLAVSESDTTIVFPKEFGVFERFDLEQEIAVALQEGLPLGALAKVAIGALDQNYVNWVRGGNFNPSGTVRVSSLRGDGVGVFGSVVRRVVTVAGAYPNSIVPGCFSDP
jgi:hypothetical protein